MRHRIPIEEMEGLNNVMLQVEKTLPFPKETHVDYMFQVYNDFIAPNYEPMKKDCRGCRNHVLNILRRIIILWREQQTNLEQQ